MKTETNIPYKYYLEESELPTAWYNVRADMKNKPAPLLNPGTLQPMTAKELDGVFCDELVQQELDDTTPYIPIPDEIREYYRMYRPSPLCRAYRLEEALGTPAKIYYKFEGNNTSGSHKLNSAIAQAYYAKKQGLKGVTTETGAGQWGTALSMACSYFGLDCKVYMVKVSYEQKPFRREVMRTYGASVTPSPSMTTNVGRKILAEHPDTTGSLGCAISEAVEVATSTPGYRYVLGSVLNQVLLHQSVIGLETKTALDKLGVKPDIIIGCAGGGSNLGGLISPFMGEKLRGEADYRFIAVEPASCPSLTRGKFVYDFCDTGMVCPLAKMGVSGVHGLQQELGGAAGGVGLLVVVGLHDLDVKIPQRLRGQGGQAAEDRDADGEIGAVEHGRIVAQLAQQVRLLREIAGGAADQGSPGAADISGHRAQAVRGGKIHNDVGRRGHALQIAQIRAVKGGQDGEILLLFRQGAEHGAHPAGADQKEVHARTPAVSIASHRAARGPSDMAVRGRR